MDQEPSSEADLVFPEPSRRRKRRGGLYALIAVTLLLALSFGFSNLRSDRADLREFVDLTKVAALEHEALAAQFRELLNFELPSADRDRISALFGSIETSTKQWLDELEALAVPATGAGSAALFEESLRAWLAGSVALENGLLVAADEPTSPIPVIAIDDALIEIQVGDRLYERFLLSLGELRTELETDIGVLPLVAYAPAAGLPVTGESLAGAVRGSTGVAAFHDVRVGQIGLDPDFTGGEHDGVGVLAFTEMVDATAVVSNAGNLPESDLTVALRVLTVADGAVVFSEQQSIVSLDPGASRTIEFLNIPVVEGITHEVTAIIMAVTGDVDGDNNTASLSFFVQAAS